MSFADRMYYARIWLSLAADYEAKAGGFVHAREVMQAAAAGCRLCARRCFTDPAPNFINFPAN